MDEENSEEGSVVEEDYYTFLNLPRTVTINSMFYGGRKADVIFKYASFCVYFMYFYVCVR
jgi:hypothetical protein